MREWKENMKERAAIYSLENYTKQANIVPGGRRIIKSLLDNQVGISMNQNGGAYR